MANLTKCKDCGKEVSKDAKTCPNCGARVSKELGCFGSVIALIIAFVALGLFFGKLSGPEPPKLPTIDKSPEMQTGRQKIINDLRQKGVFGDIQCRESGATAVVDTAFYSLDFKTKQNFVGVVYAYCFDGSNDLTSVKLRDIRTNEEVGQYSKMFGLKLD